jgi:AGCS family alanine or glycine:cation symporter
MEEFNAVLSVINSYLWGWPMIILLLGTHIYLTIRLRVPQRYLFRAIRLSFKKDGDSDGDVSQFSALTTSLAATIGTGNIIGVATAVTAGGPGAVFWCWLTGVLGISTKYAEGLLSVKYRVHAADGKMLGGPMYAIERGMGCKWLAVLFCIFTFIASFGIGGMVQSNTIATMARETFGIPSIYTAAALAVLIAAVIVWGIKGIARVCESLVPFMAIFYVVGCLALLVVNHAHLWAALCLIVKSAFTTQAATGGFIGSSMMLSMRFGIARGLFSNEAGMGSAPIVAAAARTRNPVRQALVSSTSVFWDTVVICALTGLVLVSSVIADNGVDSSAGAALTKRAFEQLPLSIGGMNVGGIFLMVGIFTFVFSTILGWSYYGEKALEYLLGSYGLLGRKIYRTLWILVVFAGALLSVDFVWNAGDFTNALMAIPNLICVVMLSGVLVRETRHYLWENHLDEVAGSDDGNDRGSE